MLTFRQFVLFSLLVCLSCHNKQQHADKRNCHPDSLHMHTALRNIQRQVRIDPQGSIDSIDRIMERLSKSGTDPLLAEAYWLRGQAEFYRSNYNAALNEYNLAQTHYRRLGDTSGLAMLHLSRSYAYSALQKIDLSLVYADSGYHLSELTRDHDMAYNCMDGLIYLHKQLNNNYIVDSLVNDLPSLAAKTVNRNKEASSYITQGNHFLDKSYMNLAIEAFYKALTLAESRQDNTEIANAMGSIALANLYLQEYQTAVSYYLKQEEILKRRGDKYELGKTYTGLGEASNALGNYPDGLAYHKRSLEISRKLDFLPSIGNALHNVGYTYYLMGDSAGRALDYVHQSMDINRHSPNQGMLAANHLLSGRILLLRGNRKAAISEFEKSVALGRQFNNPQAVMDAAQLLGQCYADLHDFHMAYRNTMIHKAISDSLISGVNLKRITQLEMQRLFEQEQHETRMRHLQESLLLEARLRKNRLVRNFVLLAGLLLSLSGVFLYRSYRKTLRAEREKEALLKEIHHRVKNNLMVISSLLNLQSGAVHDDSVRNAVKESQNRVKSMALIHQLLYQSEHFTGIDFPEYLSSLLESLMQTYGKPGQSIRYTIQAEPVKLDIDTAIPLGLIINELVTNSLKYAFSSNDGGTLTVKLLILPDHKLSLTIADDGVGLPPGFDPETSPSLGLKLVRILARQIKAEWKYTTVKGTAFTLVFEAGMRPLDRSHV